MGIKKRLIGSLLLCGACSILATAAEESKKDPAVKNLNDSLGSIGQCVVVTVSSTGGKTQEYHAKIPGDQYSPDGDNTALSLIEVGKRINDGINKAKKLEGPTTVTIRIETKVPESKP